MDIHTDPARKEELELMQRHGPPKGGEEDQFDREYRER
jgi:hypothetical protein